MSTKCKCKEVECEECPEWIFTLADLIMCMMGLFVILWVIKPSANPQTVVEQRTLTLRDRVSHHFISSLATIDTSSHNRENLLREFSAFHRAALDSGQKGATRAYYIVPSRDPQRTTHVIDLLLKEGIEVKRSDAEFEVSDVTSYWGEKSSRKKLPAGTYVIDAAQPASFLARALLERELAHE